MEEIKNNKKSTIVKVLLVVLAIIVVTALIGLLNKKNVNQKESITAKTSETLPGIENVPVPNNPTIPQATTVEKDKLPSGAINLSISSSGFSPKTFTVKAGTPVTLAITASDKSHTFAFKDPLLSSVALNASAGKTSALNLIAPTKKGIYQFRCDLPGHEDGGEVGEMIVE